MLKRYALFGFDSYYPSGGWGDFKGSYDTIKEARAAGQALKKDSWHVTLKKDSWHVIDLTTGEE